MQTIPSEAFIFIAAFFLKAKPWKKSLIQILIFFGSIPTVRHLIKPCCFCYVPSSQTLLFYRTSATLRVLNMQHQCVSHAFIAARDLCKSKCQLPRDGTATQRCSNAPLPSFIHGVTVLSTHYARHEPNASTNTVEDNALSIIIILQVELMR